MWWNKYDLVIGLCVLFSLILENDYSRCAELAIKNIAIKSTTTNFENSRTRFIKYLLSNFLPLIIPAEIINKMKVIFPLLTFRHSVICTWQKQKIQTSNVNNVDHKNIHSTHRPSIHRQHNVCGIGLGRTPQIFSCLSLSFQVKTYCTYYANWIMLLCLGGNHHQVIDFVIITPLIQFTFHYLRRWWIGGKFPWS